MKAIMLFCVFSVACSNAAEKSGLTNLVYDANLGLWIGTDNTPITKATEDELLRRKMREALPYSRTEVPEFYRLRTLGQLAKISDGIVVGEVVSVSVTATTVTSTPPRLMNDVSFSVNVVTVLLGDISLGKINLEEQWPNDDFQKMLVKNKKPYLWNRKRQPKTGDRVLMFLLKEPGLGYDQGERAFDFEKIATPRNGAYHLARGSDGIRYLDTPENTTNYLNAAEGYLRELRGKKRYADSYYSFLADLTQSPVQSIREDARSDMMYFVETCPFFDKNRIQSDDRIDEAIKYWINPAALQETKPELQKTN